MTLRPVEDTFISASCARCRPGGGGGVGDGGHFGVDWTSMHCTRVTMLKLSFNGRQCQKLSSISPVLVLSRLVFRISIVRAFRCSLVIRYDFTRIRRTFSARFWVVDRLEIWPHNGFYLRLLKILYVTFYRGTRRSLVELLVKFSVSFFVWFWTFLCPS